MSKITRNEFMGNWWVFWLLCISVLGLPLAFLYVLTGTIRIEENIDDAERFVEEFRAGKLAI